MKKLLSLIMTATLVVLASCNSDRDIPAPGGNEDNISFIIPSPAKGIVTRAIANDLENEFDFTKLSIYMFDNTTLKLDKVFTGAGITTGSISGNTVASISKEGFSGEKIFYLVVDNKDKWATDFTSDAVVGTTHEDFLKMVTDEISENEVMKAPLLLVGNSGVVDILYTSSVNVTLHRRVARFDIHHDQAASDFKIKKIIVKGANSHALVIPNATADAVNTKTYNVEFDFATMFPDAENETEFESVFYLNPVILGPDASIHIVSEDVNNPGNEVMHTVSLGTYKDQYNNIRDRLTLDIEANKRYIIKPILGQTLTFYCVVADWVAGEEVVAPVKLQPYMVSGMQAEAQQAVVNPYSNMIDITGNDATSVVTFTTHAMSNLGISVEVHDSFTIDPDDINIVKTTPKLSTEVQAYNQTCTLTITSSATSPRSEDGYVILKVYDNIDKGRIEYIVIYTEKDFYPGTQLKATLVDGIMWAPVNVGAITNSSAHLSNANIGYLYQWGRNEFRQVFVTADYAKMGDIISAPVSFDDAKGKYAHKFIVGVAGSYDWLLSDDAAKRNGLWSSAEDLKSPCPNGWRVPKNSELDALANKYWDTWDSQQPGNIFFNTGWEPENNRFRLNGDVSGESLYLNVTGSRMSTGIINNTQKSGDYWAAEVQGASYAYDLSFGPITAEADYSYKTFGKAIRCVKK